MMQRRHLLAAAAALPLPGLARPALAQSADWPTRPIRLLVPYPPGGPNDIIARLYAQPMSAMLKQPVVIENRSGAGGTIGVDAAAKAPPDGHTLVVTSSGPLVILPHVSANMPYRVPQDFTPLSILTLVPEALVATPSIGVKDMAGLLDYGRRNPGRLNIGTAGSAGISHLAAELFRTQTGLDVTVVPYRGAAPAVVDLLGGSIQLLFADLPVIMPHIRSGALNAVVLASRQRHPATPELPITAEVGYPELLADNWYSILGPARLPAPIRDRLSAVLKTASEMPEVRDSLAGQGAAAHWTSPAEFGETIIRESAVWKRIAEAANIRTD